MLRIVTQEQGNVFALSLHGRLADAWVGLVERHWQSILAAAPSAEVTVLLADVSFIDGEGERLLDRMWRHGTRLEASGCMNRHVVERIRSRTGRQGHIAGGGNLEKGA